jgi:hypothetical protein
MFELRNSGENRRKRSEIFFENLPRAYKDLISVKKNSKLFHACVPVNGSVDHIHSLYHVFVTILSIQRIEPAQKIRKYFAVLVKLNIE